MFSLSKIDGEKRNHGVIIYQQINLLVAALSSVMD